MSDDWLVPVDEARVREIVAEMLAALSPDLVLEALRDIERRNGFVPVKTS